MPASTRLSIAFSIASTASAGNIRRSQYQSRDAASYMLTLKVAGPGGAIQGPDEDESYSSHHVLPGTLTAPNELGAMHGLETFLQLVAWTTASAVFPPSPSTTPRAFHGAASSSTSSATSSPSTASSAPSTAWPSPSSTSSTGTSATTRASAPKAKSIPRLTASRLRPLLHPGPAPRSRRLRPRPRHPRRPRVRHARPQPSSWILAYPEYWIRRGHQGTAPSSASPAPNSTPATRRPTNSSIRSSAR